MKTFDLEKALAGEPVVTRDGRQVKIAGVNHEAEDLFKVVGWIDNIISAWCIDGKNYPASEDLNDLFMATKTVKKEGWVNLYKFGNAMEVWPSVYESEIAAKAMNAKYRIATVKIEWEEEI